MMSKPRKVKQLNALNRTNLASVLSNVVLPIPLRPMRPNRRPYAMFRSAPIINVLQAKIIISRIMVSAATYNNNLPIQPIAAAPS